LLFLGLKYLNSLMRIRDGDSSDPGSGMEKSRIWDKHPGSATLVGEHVKGGKGVLFYPLLCGAREHRYVTHFRVGVLQTWLRASLIVLHICTLYGK
jgi:hypothetical protein